MLLYMRGLGQLFAQTQIFAQTPFSRQIFIRKMPPMKKFGLKTALALLLCGFLSVVPISQSQAAIIGGTCETALGEYGGQNAHWDFMCAQYAIAIDDCIQNGDCDHYIYFLHLGSGFPPPLFYLRCEVS